MNTKGRALTTDGSLTTSVASIAVWRAVNCINTMTIEATVKLVKLLNKYGFLWTPCKACGQQMVVARSGKKCMNCGVINENRI